MYIESKHTSTVKFCIAKIHVLLKVTILPAKCITSFYGKTALTESLIENRCFMPE